jgi:hypothetical protein
MTRSGARNITRGNWASAALSRRFVGQMLASYRLHQRQTSLEMRQVFMAGPDLMQIIG